MVSTEYYVYSALTHTDDTHVNMHSYAENGSAHTHMHCAAAECEKWISPGVYKHFACLNACVSSKYSLSCSRLPMLKID